MANVILPPDWRLPEAACTPRDAYLDRRAALKRLGLGALALAAAPGLAAGCAANRERKAVARPGGPLETIPANAPRLHLPAARNAAFAVPERPITDRLLASSYNNFYEFDGATKEIWPLTGAYDPFPWTVEIDGLVEKPFRMDVEEMIRTFGLEERVYRFRCVEAWAMTVPWTGFPLAKLVRHAKPLSKATHLRFVSANRPDQMPGIPAQPWYPWPYFEGLRMDEATNELAFVATGLYGEPLTKQNGSPLRLALPWKYGYKGPKAVVRISFTDRQPPTFWNELQPLEYSFLSNVNPKVPHPRWSQASERLLDDDRRVPTQLFNGYGEWVAALYPEEPR